MFIASQSDPHIAGMCQLIEDTLKPVNMVTSFHRDVRSVYITDAN